MAKNMVITVQYLHLLGSFLKFPLISKVGANNSNVTMVYARYTYTILYLSYTSWGL